MLLHLDFRRLSRGLRLQIFLRFHHGRQEKAQSRRSRPLTNRTSTNLMRTYWSVVLLILMTSTMICDQQPLDSANYECIWSPQWIGFARSGSTWCWYNDVGRR
ncbi:hypothetical protein Tcan_00159 [Toxocara canis]|uniref:Uncharacterized protein n=1 Tax=Toxocara canis TaxID=6265 RepID=A0A0B2VSB9_TOXCA|nr:hypothetical protein Tcan_00159 [Toxocara canis]